ncbi:MAG: hypothetical protein K0S42_2445 [Microvirga sp.]|nr:hypothetical protein [Microvirga sp.]
MRRGCRGAVWAGRLAPIGASRQSPAQDRVSGVRTPTATPRGRVLPFDPQRAVRTPPRARPDAVPERLAAPPRRWPLAGHCPSSGGGGSPGRLRIGRGVQSGLQAGDGRPSSPVAPARGWSARWIASGSSAGTTPRADSRSRKRSCGANMRMPRPFPRLCGLRR